MPEILPVPPPVDPPARAAGRFAGFGLRLVSALVLAAVALGAVWLGGPWFKAMVIVTALLMAREWVELCLAGAGARPLWRAASFQAGPPFAAILFIAVVASALGFIALDRWAGALVAAALGAALVILAAGFVRTGDMSRPAPADRLLLGAGALYIVGPVAALMTVAAGPGGRLSLCWLLVVVWATDIGGYIAGKTIGGPHLAPRISPNKTWAGAFGGTGLAMLAGAAFAYLPLPGAASAHPGRLALAALAASIAAQAGDLFESAVKRHFAVKDSGSIIPGHGGLFDRLDGLLAAAVLLALGLAAANDTDFLWR